MARTVRNWGVVALVAAVSASLAIVPATAATSTTIKVGDNFFKPKKVTVYVGDTINWKWTGSAIHDVSVKKGPEKFHSKKQSSGKYTRVIAAPGAYRIVCTLHAGMEMKLTATTPPPPPTTAPPPPAP